MFPPALLVPRHRQPGGGSASGSKWVTPSLIPTVFSLIPNFSSSSKDSTRTTTARTTTVYVNEQAGGTNSGTFANPYTSLKAQLTSNYQFGTAFNNTKVLFAKGSSVGPSGYAGGASANAGEYQILGTVSNLTLSTYNPADGTEYTGQDADPFGRAVTGAFIPESEKYANYCTFDLAWSPVSQKVGPSGINIIGGASNIVIRGLHLKGWGAEAIRIQGCNPVRIEDCVLGTNNQSALNIWTPPGGPGFGNYAFITTTGTGMNLSIARCWIDGSVDDIFSINAPRNGTDPITINNVAGTNTAVSMNVGNFHSDILQDSTAGLGISASYFCIQHYNPNYVNYGNQPYVGKTMILQGGNGGGSNSTFKYSLIITDCDAGYCDTGAALDSSQIGYIFLPKNTSSQGTDLDTFGPEFYNPNTAGTGSVTDVVYYSAPGGSRRAQDSTKIPTHTNLDYSHMTITP